MNRDCINAYTNPSALPLALLHIIVSENWQEEPKFPLTDAFDICNAQGISAHFQIKQVSSITAYKKLGSFVQPPQKKEEVGFFYSKRKKLGSFVRPKKL